MPKNHELGTPITQQDAVYLGDNTIQWVDQVRRLDNIVHSNLSDLPDYTIKCSTLNGSVNKLFYTYKGLNKDTMCQLFRSYSFSFYVSQLWNFKTAGFKMKIILLPLFARWHHHVLRLVLTGI